jgi:type II secretory ATPase GspE/PulE/Tfp pilus assembly ATPase PilB-like protein
MGDSAVKKLQDKLTAKIQDLGIRVKETEKVLETSGAKLKLKVEGSPSDIEQLKEQVAYAEELKQVMNQIHAAKDLDQIFVELREGILGLLDAERLTLYGVDYDKKEIYSKFLDPDTLKEVKEIRVPITEQSIAGFVAKNRKTINIADAYNNAEITKISPSLSFDSSWDKKTGFRTKQILTVPLFSSDSLLTGVMQLINKKGGNRFTQEDEGRVQEIATTLGIAFYNQYQLAKKKPAKFDYLVSSGSITQAELDATIKEAREKQKEIEPLLMEKYKIAKKDIGKSLSLFYKCPFVEYEERVFIPPELVRSISLNYLKANYWIPLRRSEDLVEVLIDDPYSFQKLQDVKRLFPVKEVRFFVGLREDILKFVNSVATDLDPNAPKQSIAAILGELTTEDQAKTEEAAGPVIDENDSAIVRLTNQIIIDAYKAGASDIHIEPYSDKRETLIRFRVDGSCYEYQKVPPSYRRALSSRLKIMARLDISERRKPQDGKIKFRMPDREIELRVATIPTSGVDNEDVVMRILAASEPMPLDKMMILDRNLKELKNILDKPYGIFLCVGPTGSGKTTTLHSCLGDINDPEWKIWTAEDPVEITQYGLRQVQVQPKIGFDFAAAMRSFLRCDPDVIMVGEMRDKETCETGIEASLTGHLVFSTLHTNSAVETVTRLLEMGMDPFNFADALLGILAQRLARTICKNCKEKFHPPKAEYDALAYGYGEEEFAELGIPYDDNFFLYRGKGCESCKKSGYRGRIGLHELLIATDELKVLIQRRASVAEMLKQAKKDGMLTLVQDGIVKTLQGWTDYKQVKAVAMK